MGIWSRLTGPESRLDRFLAMKPKARAKRTTLSMVGVVLCVFFLQTYFTSLEDEAHARLGKRPSPSQLAAYQKLRVRDDGILDILGTLFLLPFFFLSIPLAYRREYSYSSLLTIKPKRLYLTELPSSERDALLVLRSLGSSPGSLFVSAPEAKRGTLVKYDPATERTWVFPLRLEEVTPTQTRIYFGAKSTMSWESRRLTREAVRRLEEGLEQASLDLPQLEVRLTRTAAPTLPVPAPFSPRKRRLRNLKYASLTALGIFILFWGSPPPEWQIRRENPGKSRAEIQALVRQASQEQEQLAHQEFFGSLGLLGVIFLGLEIRDRRRKSQSPFESPAQGSAQEAA